MTRNLKALGLSLVAVLALCAMVASAASADVFTSAESPVKVTASQGAKLDEFGTTAGTVVCESATYSGTATTPNSAITITPSYSSCFIAEIIPAVIHMKSCDYKFTINPVAGSTTGWVDIECPTAGDEITVTAGAPGTVKCTIHVPPQTVGGITYANEAGGKVKVSVASTSITYTHTAGTGLGACSTSTLQHTGTYTGSASVSGEKDVGTGAVSISVS